METTVRFTAILNKRGKYRELKGDVPSEKREEDIKEEGAARTLTGSYFGRDRYCVDLGESPGTKIDAG